MKCVIIVDNTKTLETERLILRKFNENDYVGMYENWASDENVTKYVSFNPHKDCNETKDFFKEWINDYNNGSYNWVVELKENHEIIGNISVIEISKKHNNCELGYVFGSRFWGNGYATESLRTVLEFLLKECDFHLVEAKHHASNPASGKVMEKAGMKKDGVLRERRKNKIINGYDDLVVYSIVKEDLNCC